MNCPRCDSEDTRIIRTEVTQKADKRRHQCVGCGQRWGSTARIDKISTATNSAQQPLLIALPTATNSARLFSDPDLTPDQDPSIQHRDLFRAPARSSPNAKFTVLLDVFSKRWLQSYRRPYPITPADRNQLSRFMREHPEYLDTFTDICDRYLSDRRQFLIDRSGGHTLTWLVTRGLALYGGTPRESAEQCAARMRREHEQRKARNKAMAQSPEMRDLVAMLADQKGASYG